MNLDEIKLIVNHKLYPDEIKEEKIIDILSEDENVLFIMMSILDKERKTKKELISDMNVELSKADVFIESAPDISEKNNNNGFNKESVLKSITDFYRKYRKQIKSIFNKNLD